VGVRLTECQSGQSALARDLHRLEESRVSWLFQIPLLLPLEFLRGLDVQLADAERLQPAYLLGKTRLGGWWYWYAAAALIKLPLPALIVLALALIRLPGALWDRDPIFCASLCLLVPAVEIALTIMATTGTGTNAAFRYLLPSLALLCVWVGRAWSARSKTSRMGTIGLLTWLLLNALIGLPDHLGWQNEVGWVCQRWNGRPALIGDSLDWGQDVARLNEWITRHCHEGSTVVCVYGLGVGNPYGLEAPAARPLSEMGDQPGYLAVSSNILYGYDSMICIKIAGGESTLIEGQRNTLLRHLPLLWVGRTISIYRLRDLPPGLVALDSQSLVRAKARRKP
jgi:hypothetical protein